MEKYFVVGLFIVIGGVVAISSLMSRKKSAQQENRQINKQTTHLTNEQSQTLQPPKRFHMGKYLGGIPNSSAACEIAYCSVAGDTFKFTSGMRGVEFASIPQAKINTIIVEDKSLVAQKLNGIDKATLDKIINPKTKQNKYCCLVIDWNDNDGTRQSSFFEFAGSEKQSLATDAANVFNRWMSREDTSGDRLPARTI
jgi:hypothetical protein